MKKWIGLLFVSLLLIGCGPSEPIPGSLGDVRQPIHIVLNEHEVDGHTIARHVDKPDDYLVLRLKHGSKLQTVSTFSSLEVAEASVNAVLNINREQVARWWQGNLARQAFFARVPTHGRYLTREMWNRDALDVKSIELSGNLVVRVVLVRKGDDFYVLTAFPQPDDYKDES